jgi:glycopeptide antibiotics resistance protein
VKDSTVLALDFEFLVAGSIFNSLTIVLSSLLLLAFEMLQLVVFRAELPFELPS